MPYSRSPTVSIAERTPAPVGAFDPVKSVLILAAGRGT